MATTGQIYRDSATGKMPYGDLPAGLWQHIETKTVAGSHVTQLDFDATLDGDVDKHYFVTGRIINGANAGSNYAVRINEATAVLVRSQLQQVSTTVAGLLSTSPFFAIVAANTGAGYTAQFQWLMEDMESGSHPRCFNSFATHASSGANAIERNDCSFCITTPAAGVNITKLGILAGTADGLGIGTRISIWKRVG